MIKFKAINAVESKGIVYDYFLNIKINFLTLIYERYCQNYILIPSKNIHLKTHTYLISFFNPRLSVQIKEL